jgi:hypothetical protein
VTNSLRIYNTPDIVPTQPSVHLGYVQVNTGIEINSLDYPSIAKNLIGYHSIKTYRYVLSQQHES